MTLAKCPQDKNLLIYIDNKLRKSEEPDHAYHFNVKALQAHLGCSDNLTTAAEQVGEGSQAQAQQTYSYELHLKWLGTETFETSCLTRPLFTAKTSVLSAKLDQKVFDKQKSSL